MVLLLAGQSGCTGFAIANSGCSVDVLWNMQSKYEIFKKGKKRHEFEGLY